jgi:VWFA-related protein
MLPVVSASQHCRFGRSGDNVRTASTLLVMKVLSMRKLVLLIFSVTAFAQAPQAAAPVAASNPLIVHFQFEPKKGQPATDLVPADIEIREDGTPQQIVLFEGGSTRQRTVPVHVNLLFDCPRTALSGSPLIPEVLQKNLLDANPNVLISMYTFSGGPVLLNPPTRDREVLRKALNAPMSTHPPQTFLLDHIQAVTQNAAKAGPAIRMLVVFSSAQAELATSAQTALQERFDVTVRTAQQAGINLYPVLLRSSYESQVLADDSTGSESSRSVTYSTPAYMAGSLDTQRAMGTGVGSASGPNSPAIAASYGQRDLRSKGVFKNLGSSTGGESFEVLANAEVLPTVLQSISRIIQNDYVVGFNPSTTGGTKRHKVQVVLRDKERGKIEGGSMNAVH